MGNRLAIVTGGAGGIGLAFAKELSRRGCSLILVDKDAGRLKSASDDLKKSSETEVQPVEIYTMPLDLTGGDIIDRIEIFCNNNGLEPDILINNAGVFSFLPVADHSEKRIGLFLDLHVRAVTLLSRWFVQRRKETGWGCILNMSSMSCWMPMPGIAMYSSTKAYIRVFTRALHYEIKDYGLTATVACPGGIATDLFGLPAPLKKLAVGIKVLDTPDRFARKAINRMLKGKKQYINGFLNRFSIFFIAVLPTGIRMMIKRKLLDKGVIR